MAETWISTNEAEDVAGSLRHVLRIAPFVADDPQAWKWVALALHSALQGACICHLTTTAAPVGAVTEQNAAEWLTYFDSRHTEPHIRRPKTHLMSLPGLLKAVRKSRSAGGPSSDIVVAISDSELNWLRRFHDDIRNQYVHFEPATWSIEVSGVPEIARLVARIVEQILECGWAFRHLENRQRDDLKRSLSTLRTLNWPA
jgi:hypothetical protein